MSDIYGEKFKVRIYGASHAPAIGAVVEGMPAGIKIDGEELEKFMKRRAPGQSLLSTQRKEADKPEFLSGVRDGVTDGETLHIEIKNTNARSGDYSPFADCPRPSHADYTARIKWDGKMDMAGGGPFSGRLTAPICAVGNIAMQLMAQRGITIGAHIASIADVSDAVPDSLNITAEELKATGAKTFPVFDDEAGEAMQERIMDARRAGDSVGGVIECFVTGFPAGIGGPLFEGIEGRIASAVFGVPAVRGIEFGAGFRAATMKGSEHNDPFIIKDGKVQTAKNDHGGILGGISSAMPIVFRVAMKPTPSIALEQDSVSLSEMKPKKLVIGGRHDPCIVHRAVPVIEAVAAIALLDALLCDEDNKNN